VTLGEGGFTRPMVVAHRGASAARAEHTLAAYVLALESGADALECDVRLTRDAQLVCVHDHTVNRTSDGTGAVSSLELATLQRLDFGSWHDGPGSSARILTLESLLELIRDAARPVDLLVETKHPSRFGARVERELVALLARFPDQRVTVMSFAESAIRRIGVLAPGRPTVALIDAPLGARRAAALPAGVHIAGPSLRLLRKDPGLVERAHALGNQVYVWTVDEPADLQYVLDLRVDAVITNRPAEIVAAVNSV
jgi:glycerophosphoryl diester phosphodiesterase